MLFLKIFNLFFSDFQVVLLSVSAALCFGEETPASTATLALQPVVHTIASPYPYLIPTVAAVKVGFTF